MALSRDPRPADRAPRSDDVAFERLHAVHQPEVLAFCRHLTGSLEDAEDAVQHTFLAAYRQIADSDEPLEWRPWLFTVARNRCLTLLRARREQPLAEPDIAATSFDGLAIQVERRQELRDLVRDMAGLPEPQRAALVLSQLESLSYREIGAVLDVTPEKVKALVFQARSSLVSTREARDAPCVEIRREIATARGPALRRRLLRRHVGQCEGCRDFEVAVMRQRDDLGILLPVAPSAGLGQAVLGHVLGREGATAASAGGAAVASGGTGAGLAGTLAALGASGALKLAVVVAIAGTSAAGAVTADLPAKVGHAGAGALAGSGADRGDSAGEGGAAVTPEARAGDPGAPSDRVGARSPGGREEALDGLPERVSTSAETSESGGDSHGRTSAGGDGAEGGEQAAGGGTGALPPGLAKKDELPPGLAKRDELPPGLAKREGAAPGQSGKAPKGPPSGGNQGNGNGNAGSQGNAGGQGNAGAQGNAGGANQGNGNGNGNGNAGSQGNAGGQGNAGAQGNAGNGQGNSNGNGNGRGKPN